MEIYIGKSPGAWQCSNRWGCARDGMGRGELSWVIAVE